MKLLLPLFLASGTSAFVSPSITKSSSQSSSSSSLFGIAEWRDMPTSSIGVIPMASKDILLQGQSKYVQFVTDEEMALVHHALEEQEGMVGMGLKMFDTGVLPTMPLLHIESVVTTEDFGLFAKVRAVGRCRIDQQPDIDNASVVGCQEVFDDTEDYQQANQLANDIEALIADMSVIERIIMTGDDRMTRFQEAHDRAMAHDAQGYHTASSSSLNGRSWQELSAIAWAAYSTSATPDQDATFRLNAMNMQSIVERLDLAVHWLTDVQQQVEERISAQS